MTSTVKQVQETIRAFEQQANGNPELVKLQEFYLDMQRKGLVRKREYDLPLVDTIGRELYQAEPTDPSDHA